MKNVIGVNMRKIGWLERLWLVGPVAIWFSYQPLVRFGQDSSTYYELSLVMVYLLLVGLVSIPSIWRARQKLVGDTAVRLVTAFVGLSLLTLVWTSNLTRGVLTAGVIGLLYLTFLGALAEQKRLRSLLPALAKLLVVSAVSVSVLAIGQVVAGIWLSRDTTLLCAGCAADQFGFARPNVFAIEPQFLGSLLLAPLLVVVGAYIKGKREASVIVSLLLMSTALFLTLSRGAVFAFAVGVLVLFAFAWRRWQAVARTVLLLAGAFVATLLIQGSVAALNPRVEATFYSAVSSSVNQLTLGVISLPAQHTTSQTTPTSKPVFNGYVAQSTDTRLNLSGLALSTWASSPVKSLFGVGLGGSGAAMHAQYPTEIDAREIVQNEYVEVLLEYGLPGLALFALLLFGFLYSTRQTRWPWAVAAAYMVQWLFFSGYPNALHTYFVFIALYVSSGTSLKPNARLS